LSVVSVIVQFSLIPNPSAYNQLLCLDAAPLHGTGMLAYLGLVVGEDLLAEIEDGQGAGDTSRSADGDDGKVPVKMIVSNCYPPKYENRQDG
jgi:hypothetical protein